MILRLENPHLFKPFNEFFKNVNRFLKKLTRLLKTLENMTDFDRARILVLGDSGVGKSSLVHLIARGKPLSHITYTIGASNEVKLHEYKEGTPSQRTYWIGKTSICSP